MSNWLNIPTGYEGVGDADLCHSHRQIRSQIRWTRYAAPVIVLSIMTGYIVHIKGQFEAIDTEKVGAAFEQRTKYVVPKLQRAASEIGESVAPVLAKAFEKTLDTATKRFGERLDLEMAGLRSTLPVRLENLLIKQMERAHAEQVEGLYAAFPELRKEPKKVEQLMISFNEGFRKWALNKLTGTFNRHLVELEHIKQTLNGYIAKQDDGGKAGAAGAKRKRVNPEQLLTLWLEILDETLAGDGGGGDLLAGTDDPGARAKAAANVKEAKQ